MDIVQIIYIKQICVAIKLLCSGNELVDYTLYFVYVLLIVNTMNFKLY